MSFRAFLYCWLQILLGGIRPLSELGGRISRGRWGEAVTLLLMAQTALDTLLPSDGVKALALHSGRLNSVSGLLKRTEKRLDI